MTNAKRITGMNKSATKKVATTNAVIFFSLSGKMSRVWVP